MESELEQELKEKIHRKVFGLDGTDSPIWRMQNVPGSIPPEVWQRLRQSPYWEERNVDALVELALRLMMQRRKSPLGYRKPLEKARRFFQFFQNARVVWSARPPILRIVKPAEGIKRGVRDWNRRKRRPRRRLKSIQTKWNRWKGRFHRNPEVIQAHDYREDEQGRVHFRDEEGVPTVRLPPLGSPEWERLKSKRR
jgi:hypothetical protein